MCENKASSSIHMIKHRGGSIMLMSYARQNTRVKKTTFRQKKKKIKRQHPEAQRDKECVCENFKEHGAALTWIQLIISGWMNINNSHP